jgi:AP-3 complex subunit delta-1
VKSPEKEGVLGVEKKSKKPKKKEKKTKEREREKKDKKVSEHQTGWQLTGDQPVSLVFLAFAKSPFLVASG